MRGAWDRVVSMAMLGMVFCLLGLFVGSLVTVFTMGLAAPSMLWLSVFGVIGGIAIGATQSKLPADGTVANCDIAGMREHSAKARRLLGFMGLGAAAVLSICGAFAAFTKIDHPGVSVLALYTVAFPAEMALKRSGLVGRFASTLVGPGLAAIFLSQQIGLEVSSCLYLALGWWLWRFVGEVRFVRPPSAPSL